MIGKTWPIPGQGDAKVLGPRNLTPTDDMWRVLYPSGEERLVREQILRRILEEREPS